MGGRTFMAPVEPGGEGTAPDLHGQRFLLILAVILIALSLLVVWPILSVVLLALFLAYLLQPVHKWLAARLPWEQLAAVLVVLLVLVALVLPLGYIAFVFANQASQLASSVAQGAGPQRQAAQALTGLGVPQQVANATVERAAGQFASALQSAFVQLVTMATYLLIGTVVFFILLYFLLLGWDALAAWARRVTPLDPRRRDRLFARTGERVQAIFIGTLAVAAIQGVVAAVGWWLLGFPAPVFWGFVMTVFEVVPLLGSFMVLLPAALVAIVQGRVFAGVALVVYTLIIVGLVDNVVRPYLIGERSGVHPAVILVGITGGILAFGVVGFVLGPLLLSLVAPVVEAWARPDEEPLRSPEDEG